MQPEDRQSIFETLKKELEAGRVKIRDRETIDALSRAKAHADGTVNLHAPDPRVRSLALAVSSSDTHTWMTKREL
jgi:hypothetical protein